MIFKTPSNLSYSLILWGQNVSNFQGQLCEHRWGEFHLSCCSLQTLQRNLKMVLKITRQETFPEFLLRVVIGVWPLDYGGSQPHRSMPATSQKQWQAGRESTQPTLGCKHLWIPETWSRDVQWSKGSTKSCAKEGNFWMEMDLESPLAARVTNVLRHPRDLLAYLSSGSGTRKQFTKNKHIREITSAWARH